MSTARRLQYSYDEYLRALQMSSMRLEYQAGEILAMAGGTPEHAALAGQVIALLGAKLPGSCRVFSSDLKIRIANGDFAVFPDASVVCGKLESARDDKEAIANPGLVVEVTSPSTEAYDRGAKLAQYKSLKSVQSVWLVSHAGPRVTVVERHGKTWKVTERRGGDQLTLASPAITLDVDTIYTALEGL